MSPLLPSAEAAWFLGAFVAGIGLTILTGGFTAARVAHAARGHHALLSVGRFHMPRWLTFRHVHAASNASAGANSDASAGAGLFLPESLIGFLTVFGGTGYALSLAGSVPLPVVLAAAGGLGLAVATLLYRVGGAVVARQTPWLRSEEGDIVGALARVSSAIVEGGFGEIVIDKAGRRRVESARAADGKRIPVGEDVIVLAYVRGVAQVESCVGLFGPSQGAPGLGRAPERGSGPWLR